MSTWIRVKDKLPEPKNMVLVVAVNPEILRIEYTTDMYCAWIDRNGRWCDRWPQPFNPTHWMPLPEPPK